MAKISINTLDKQKTYEYQKSFIKADKYEVEIKANQLHSPNAAKLIILNGKIIYSFYLYNL